MRGSQLIAVCLLAGSAVAQTPAKPNGDATLAAKIASDGRPAVEVFGEATAITAVDTFAQSKGWQTERLVSRLVNIQFGPRPNEKSVAELLTKLRAKAFGNATLNGVMLWGSPSYAPPSPPSPRK